MPKPRLYAINTHLHHSPHPHLTTIRADFSEVNVNSCFSVKAIQKKQKEKFCNIGERYVCKWSSQLNIRLSKLGTIHWEICFPPTPPNSFISVDANENILVKLSKIKVFFNFPLFYNVHTPNFSYMKTCAFEPG